MSEWIEIQPSNLFIYTKDENIGLEIWELIGVIDWYIRLDNNTVFEGESIKVSIPSDRTYKLEIIEA